MIIVLVSCDIITCSSSDDYPPATKRLHPLSRTSMTIQSEVTPSTTLQQETTPSTAQETTPGTSYTTVLSTQVTAITSSTTTTPSMHTESVLISLNNREPANEMIVDGRDEPTISMTSLSPVHEERVLTADLANVVSDDREQTGHEVGGDNNPETGSGTQEPENAEVLPEQEVDLVARSEGDGDISVAHEQEFPSEG